MKSSNMFAPYRSLCTAIKGFLDYKTLIKRGLVKYEQEAMKLLFAAHKQNEYRIRELFDLPAKDHRSVFDR